MEIPEFPNSKFISSNLNLMSHEAFFTPFRFLIREIYSLDPQGSQRSSFLDNEFSKQSDPTYLNRPDSETDAKRTIHH